MIEKVKAINVLQMVSSLEVGGLEKLLIDFIKASEVNSRNVNFVILVMNDKVDDGLKQELLKTKYKLYLLNRPVGHRHPKYLPQLMEIIKKENIDIIHTHNGGGKYWSVLCKLINPKIKLVHTLHETGVVEWMNSIKMWIHRVFIDKNIAISTDIYKSCLKNKINKVIKIYNGIKLKNFIVNKNDFSKNKTLNIINVARISHPKKGHDVLIKAIKICKDKGIDFTCNIIGGVYYYDQKSIKHLEKIVEELELKDDIHFLGNREDIPEILSKADLFILPSRYEGMPISLLEAMASRLPIIASDIAGSNDLIKHGQNGLLFESENYIDLADKIISLYNNREKMQELAQNAFDYVKDFDISLMYEKYCDLYKKLTNSN